MSVVRLNEAKTKMASLHLALFGMILEGRMRASLWVWSISGLSCLPMLQVCRRIP